MKILLKSLCLLAVLFVSFGSQAQTLISTDPADGTSLESFEGVTLSFDQSVTPKRSWSDDVKICKDSPSGTKISVAEWTMQSVASDKIKIFPVNFASTLTPVELEEGTDYYVTIPAGNVNGYTQDIVLHYIGAKAETKLAIQSISPKSDSSVDTFKGVTLEFNSPVSLRSSWSNNIKLREGSTNGSQVNVLEWELEKKSDNSVLIYPGNYSAVLTPVVMEEGKEYYLTIPAGEIKEWTEDIVLHYVGSTPVAAPITLVSTDPAEGTSISVFDGVNLTFSDAVSLSSSWSMSIKLREGSTTGNTVSVAEWELEKKGDETVRIYPGNSASYLYPVEFEAGKEYYLTIPKGTIKEYNEDIVLHFSGPSAEANHEVMIYGTLLYSDSWKAGQSRGGMYRIVESGVGGFQPVAIDNRLSAQMGGARTGNEYFASFANDLGITTLWVNTRWDMNTWDPIEITAEGTMQSMASCMTSNPVNGIIYGRFADGTFGTLDPVSKKVTGISKPIEDWNAMACNDDGEIFAIDMKGNLLSVNPTTGDYTTIGSTGLTPELMTSATIDPDSGRMFYALHTNQKCAMYEIDTETANATLKFEMPGNEWFTGLYILGREAANDAPEVVENLSVVSNGAGTSASLEFTAPKVTYGGKSLTGNLTYTVTCAGETIATGSCEAGAKVTTEVTLPREGSVSIAVVTSNDAGVSPKQYATPWIGADTPLAPSSVTLSENADGGYLIEWTPVTEGVNDGYIDADQIAYTVVRYPDNLIVAVDVKDCKYIDKDNTIVGAAFKYGVTAKYGDKVSKETQSSEMKIGAIIPPYEATFDDASSISKFTLINANNDGEKWEWNSSKKAARMSASSARPMDDWLVTPAIELESGKAYTFSIDAASQSTSYPESFEVKLGSSATVDGLNSTLIEKTKVLTVDYTNYTAIVKVPETGIYYIGVHACSEADTYSIYVDNLKLSAGEIGDYNNLAIESFSATRYAEAGAEIDYAVNVINKGTTATQDCKVEIYADDQKVAEIDANGIESGERSSLVDKIQTNRKWNKYTNLEARIMWNDDEDSSDNISAPYSVEIHIPTLPVVSDVRGTSDGATTLLAWSKPDMSATVGDNVTENFDDYEPFVYDRSGSWTMYDRDGAATFGFSDSNISFPGMEEPSSFFVFDNSYRVEYSNQEALTAHSGNQYMVSFAAKGNVQTENFLISPRLSGKAQTISFYARAFSTAYGETFDVFASSTGMQMADFTAVKTHKNIAAQWKEYTFDLPEGTLFFAIRHSSTNSYMMMIDDVNYTEAGLIDHNLELVGYNVYCDGEKLNDEPLKTESYTHQIVSRNTPSFEVEAVYNKGVSEKSEVAKISGVESIDDDNAVEYFNLQGIKIENPEKGTVVIVRKNGRNYKAIAK